MNRLFFIYLLGIIHAVRRWQPVALDVIDQNEQTPRNEIAEPSFGNWSSADNNAYFRLPDLG